MARPQISLPTWITLARLLGIPVILYGLTIGTEPGRRLALIAFVIAAGTDWLDGYLARKLDQITELGKVLDPLVDKLLVLAPLLGLVEQGQIPAWGAFLLIGRELGIAGWRVSQPQISGANRWGKLKTVLQIVAIIWLLLEWPGDHVLFWSAVVLTLWSGILYLIPPGAAKEQP